jgi:hypothetical protein
MPRKPYIKTDDPAIPETPFTWDLALKEKEQQRYEKIRAEKRRNGEERHDPKTLRNRFIDGFIDRLIACGHG